MIRMHGEAGQLGHAFLKRIQSRATNNDTIMFEHKEALNLHLQQLAAALDQRAIVFQRFEQTQNAADIVNFCRPQFLDRIGRQQRADPAMGK